MITIKNAAQIGKMRAAGALLYEVLQRVKEAVRPGVSTLELDALAERLIRNAGAVPSFLGYDGFPNTLCTSVNDVVVHGIPSEDQVLREGDIISIDCGLVLDGWQADSALTVGAGEISAEARRLIEVTEQCFFAGARTWRRPGARWATSGSAVEAKVEERVYACAGLDRSRNRPPNAGGSPRCTTTASKGLGPGSAEGMTLAVEPMICQKDWRVTIDDDGWCARTADHGLCAHYEHTLAINEEGYPEILTLPGFSWEKRE